MAREKTSVQIFLEEQLKDRGFVESFYQGLDELRLAVRDAQHHAAMTAGQRKNPTD